MPQANDEIISVVKPKKTKERTILGVPLGIDRDKVKKGIKAAQKKAKK